MYSNQQMCFLVKILLRSQIMYYVKKVRLGLGSGSEPDPNPASPWRSGSGRIHNPAVYSPQDVTSTPPLPPPPPCTAWTACYPSPSGCARSSPPSLPSSASAGTKKYFCCRKYNQFFIIPHVMQDERCLSRILIFIHPGSPISDPGPNKSNKRGGKQFVVLSLL